MIDQCLSALATAWFITFVATTGLVTALAAESVWDSQVYSFSGVAGCLDYRAYVAGLAAVADSAVSITLRKAGQAAFKTVQITRRVFAVKQAANEAALVHRWSGGAALTRPP
jgi:hypothetical protein